MHSHHCLADQASGRGHDVVSFEEFQLDGRIRRYLGQVPSPPRSTLSCPSHCPHSRCLCLPPSPSITLKNQIRSIKRMLRKNLPDEVMEAQENKFEGFKKQ
ncbi:hypothetical protein EV2_026704 [Malus domestica]